MKTKDIIWTDIRPIRTVCLHARSKIIIAGENAVAFGGTAVVSGVDLFSRCMAALCGEPHCNIQIGSEIFQFDKNSCVRARRVAQTVCAEKRFDVLAGMNSERSLFWVRVALGELLANGMDFPNFRAVIQLRVPLGSGVGGSASITSLVVRAIFRLMGLPVSREQLYRLCALGDRIAHGGGGTGTDSAGVVFPGSWTWSRSKGAQQLEAARSIQFILCHSGQIKCSSTSLNKLRELQSNQPAEFDGIMREFHSITARVQQAMKRGPDLRSLGDLMNQNQDLLRLTGASTPQIDQIVDTSLEAGALGAKVTGGGCGGFVLILAPPARRERVVTALQSLNPNVLLVHTNPGIGQAGAAQVFPSFSDSINLNNERKIVCVT